MAGAFPDMDAAFALIAPGTPMREAIDDVIAARTGAIIVVGDEAAVRELCSGGFRLDVPFSPARMYELAKMDGAIVLDGACERILMANVHLLPDPELPTSETGMRHRAAERVSRQTKAFVIAISHRREVVSLYLEGEKVSLEPLQVAFARADQALQTLQRYRARLDEVTSRLTGLEFEDLVTITEVARAVHSFEMLRRVSSEVGRHIARLGREGRLLRMQTEELCHGVAEEYQLLVRDYAHGSTLEDAAAAKERVAALPDEWVDDAEKVALALGYPQGAHAAEDHVHARGYRLLRRVPGLPASVIERLVDRFDGAPGLLDATLDLLDDVDGVGAHRARSIIETLRRLRRNVAI